MKRLIAVMSLLAALTIPAEASHRDFDVRGIVGHAGCRAAVVTSDQHEIWESFYDYDANQLYIGTAPGVPDAAMLTVLYHEIGHCLQFQDGLFDGRPAILLELDADRRAADMACRAGMDGRGMLRATLKLAQEVFDYNGDFNHGTLDQRISMGRLALSCEVAQAPMLARN